MYVFQSAPAFSKPEPVSKTPQEMRSLESRFRGEQLTMPAVRRMKAWGCILGCASLQMEREEIQTHLKFCPRSASTETFPLL